MIKPRDVPFPIGPATYQSHGREQRFKGGGWNKKVLTSRV